MRSPSTSQPALPNLCEDDESRASYDSPYAPRGLWPSLTLYDVSNEVLIWSPVPVATWPDLAHAGIGQVGGQPRTVQELRDVALNVSDARPSEGVVVGWILARDTTVVTHAQRVHEFVPELGATVQQPSARTRRGPWRHCAQQRTERGDQVWLLDTTRGCPRRRRF